MHAPFSDGRLETASTLPIAFDCLVSQIGCLEQYLLEFAWASTITKWIAEVQGLKHSLRMLHLEIQGTSAKYVSTSRQVEKLCDLCSALHAQVHQVALLVLTYPTKKRFGIVPTPYHVSGSGTKVQLTLQSKSPPVEPN